MRAWIPPRAPAICQALLARRALSTLAEPAAALTCVCVQVCKNDLLNFGRLHFFFPDSRLSLDLNTDKTLKVGRGAAQEPLSLLAWLREAACFFRDRRRGYQTRLLGALASSHAPPLRVGDATSLHACARERALLGPSVTSRRACPLVRLRRCFCLAPHRRRRRGLTGTLCATCSGAGTSWRSWRSGASSQRRWQHAVAVPGLHWG